MENAPLIEQAGRGMIVGRTPRLLMPSQNLDNKIPPGGDPTFVHPASWYFCQET